jgi:hypothetical protein
VPGRPKTDRLDAIWLAKVMERGLCRPSLVHPKPIVDALASIGWTGGVTARVHRRSGPGASVGDC